MMKKLALLLAAMLLALPLASCNAEDISDTTTTASTTTTATTTTTTSATTTRNPILDKLPETEEKPDTPENPDTPDTPEASKDVKIGTVNQLIDTINKINKGELPEDTNITLTADIKFPNQETIDAYEPLYRYSGTFDGAGYSIMGLKWKFVMKNGGGDMPNANEVGSYVLEDLPDGTAGRYARGTVALLILQLNAGGTVKNLTLYESSLTIECSYNKNYQMYVGGLIGYINGGEFESTVLDKVVLDAVSITVPANVNYNQGFTGYAAPLAGRVSGRVQMIDCGAGAYCKVDTSDNVMFNTGTLIGVLEEGGFVAMDNCDSGAECKVHANPTKDVLAYKGDGITLGGVAGGLIGTDLNK